MPKMIFVNLPVRDLAASTAFYVALGGTVNPQFSGETSTSLMFSDTIFVMLLTHAHYGEFTKRPIADARLGADVADAGGADALVGHRGVRLSGGQVQRLALARALAADTELLLADDVSSALDAATEIELWQALRERHTTVIGATSKRAALAQADRVVVLVEGEVAQVGPWSELAGSWGQLAG